ncbi:MAG: hypothetical protein EA343_14950 [Nodularia sp. (in: Bacteria)]|nr:MAG: hypothetical protein EA343_14950 [Nodularia sp. (in: cyanobacteria)]
MRGIANTYAIAFLAQAKTYANAYAIEEAIEVTRQLEKLRKKIERLELIVNTEPVVLTVRCATRQHTLHEKFSGFICVVAEVKPLETANFGADLLKLIHFSYILNLLCHY